MVFNYNLNVRFFSLTPYLKLMTLRAKSVTKGVTEVKTFIQSCEPFYLKYSQRPLKGNETIMVWM